MSTSLRKTCLGGGIALALCAAFSGWAAAALALLLVYRFYSVGQQRLRLMRRAAGRTGNDFAAFLRSFSSPPRCVQTAECLFDLLRQKMPAPAGYKFPIRAMDHILSDLELDLDDLDDICEALEILPEWPPTTDHIETLTGILTCQSKRATP